VAERDIHGLYRDLVNRKIDRRGFIRGAAALGISAQAVGLFLKAADVRAQDASAPPKVAEGDGTLYAGVDLSIVAIDASVKQPLDEARPEFEAATGAKVSIVAYPIPEVLPKFIEDQTTGANEIDGVMIGMWWLGELVSGDFIFSLDEWMADPKFQDAGYTDEFTGMQALRKYGDKTYVIPLDCDGQVLYYRRDLLTDETHMAAYKEATGNELGVPKTWDEMIAIATYFNGKDLGTGTPGSGVSMHLKTGGQGMFHYMSLSAPFVIGPSNPKNYWFNPENMDPLVKSAGHVKAMQAYLDLAKQGPEAQLGWALGEAWDWFLNGNAAFTFSWGDVAALAVQNNSFVKGKVGTAQLPGTASYIDPLTGTETPAENGVNYVGNTTGGSWSGVVAKNASNPEAVYYFWALISAKPKIQFYAGRGSDGVDPGRMSQMPPDVVEGGTGDIQLYLSQGWDEQDAKEYTRAYYDSFNNPNQFPYLRIPGTNDYWTQMDIRLAEAVSGSQTPDAACEAMFNDFNEITDRLGKDAQLESYKASFGL